MTELMNEVSEALSQRGYQPSGERWEGMEAAVLGLEDGLVAKIWHSRTRDSVERIQAFYADLATMSLPFATPEIIDVLDAGQVVSVERRLDGETLQDWLARHPDASTDQAIEAVLGVLLALRQTSKPADAHLLPLFEGTVPTASTEGSRLLLDVARRRLETSQALQDAMPKARATLDALESWLSGQDLPDVLTHGDLCSENVLVDESGAVTAVLDWGFLTCYAPPAADLSIAAGILDMYSDDARATDDAFTRKILETSDVDADDLLRFRALYAVITATAYSPDGTDGHFQWCAAQLGRADVQAAVHGR